MVKKVKVTFVSDSGKEHDSPLECYLNDMYLLSGNLTNGIPQSEVPEIINKITKKFKQLEEFLDNDNKIKQFKQEVA